MADGSCMMATAVQCADATGTYQGDETSCDPNPCPQPVGACCFSGGSCMEDVEAACDVMGGVFQGGETVCDPNSCTQDCGTFFPGDMDGDLDVDGDDIQGFINAMINQSRDASDVCPGDFDGSRMVDAPDVVGMVAALLAAP